MSFTAMVAGLFAVAEAVPAIRDLIIMVNNRILEAQIARVGGNADEERKKVDDLMSDLSKASTKEQRREASKKLSALLYPNK